MSGHRSWQDLDEVELAAIGQDSESSKVEPKEREIKRSNWPIKWRRKPPKKPLFGLALSGGGIRSATFNLGLLQELDRLGLLKYFHYLSTVSGGGYVGGFWSAWLARNTTEPPRTFPGSSASGLEPEPEEVRHLREFSNFLRPRASLLSVDTARIVAALLGGVVPCIVLATVVIVLALSVWWMVGWLLIGQGPGEALIAWPWLPALTMVILTGILLVVTERLMWSRSLPVGFRPQTAERGRYWLPATFATLGSGLCAMGVWLVAPSPAALLLPIQPGEFWNALGDAVTPAAPWLVVLVPFLVWRAFTSRCRNEWAGRVRQSATDRVLTRIFLSAVAWSVLGTVWTVGQVLADGGPGAVLGALGTGTTAGAVFAWLRHTLMSQANQASGGSVLLRLGRVSYQALAYLTLAAIAAGIAALLIETFVAFGSTGLKVVLSTALLILILGLISDPHEIGLHRFYRARLVRAYLGPSNIDAYGRSTAEARDDDITFDRLQNHPLHLVCCAANDLSGDSLGSLSRGADTAVISKHGFQVGDRWWPWDHRYQGPWLSDVLTASGAAFNSHMGSLSVRLGNAVTFLLTALGLRLGLWLRRPAAETSILQREGVSTAGTKDSDPEDHRRPLKRPWGHLFFYELFSASRADADWIHLSDGAHFENLALYELVRRHCRVILVSDCGADSDRAFDDFGNAVRKVREDFGVEINIDVRPLKGGDGGKAKQPMVAGDILYPPTEDGQPGDTGVLLYFKPTLTENLPPDVDQYAGRNEDFPHETTIDQFYDEAQWESYRRLGSHVVASAFDPLREWLPKEAKDGEHPENQKETQDNLIQLFLWARYFWPSLPDREVELDGFEKAWARLEDRLAKDSLAGLRQEVTLRPGGRSKCKISKKNPVAALPAIREAVRLMEGLYLRTGFGATYRSPSHYRYRGWLNRLAVWSAAPCFRAWWPWLAPFYSGRFTAFMEEAFDLPAKSFGGGEVKKMQSRRPEGLAWRQLEARDQESERQQPAGKGKEVKLGYFVDLSDGTSLNAAVLRFVRDKSGPRALWKYGDSGDLYVVPGLWGLGIGATCLAESVKWLRSEGYSEARVEPTDPKSVSASQEALYEGAGFYRVGGAFVLKFDSLPPTPDAPD